LMGDEMGCGVAGVGWVFGYGLESTDLVPCRYVLQNDRCRIRVDRKSGVGSNDRSGKDLMSSGAAETGGFYTVV
jgi:hypothetical protein